MKAESSDLSALTLKDFNSIRALVRENTGISLSAAKMELVRRRFSPRLRALGLPHFAAYVTYLREDFATESVHFCNSITTNLTAFFRENHHYELLAGTVLPALLTNANPRTRIRLWSAGCSTGQEAYCMAITLRRLIPDLQRRDIRILATDLDENCLVTARRGVYPVREFEPVPEGIIRDYFTVETSGSGALKKEMLSARASLRELITFNKLNLMHAWPMKGTFDVIFCRNVFIYFEKSTQVELVRKFAALQRSGSYLCLGHSEVMPNPAQLGYQLVGKTAYVRL